MGKQHVRKSAFLSALLTYWSSWGGLSSGLCGKQVPSGNFADKATCNLEHLLV